MKNELFERELQNTSINDVSLADYVKENYLPISVIDEIRAEMEERKLNSGGEPNRALAFNVCLKIIDKYKAESDHKCHTCKHYMSGEYDGSCDSYICEHYSGWEARDKE